MEMDRKYYSEWITDTDIHAGGIFFCVIYQNCLEFQSDGKVIFTKNVVNAFRPMDPQDIEHLKRYKVEGTYFHNERGYLVCKFEEIYWEFTGMEIGKSGMIAFRAYDSRLSRSWGETYTVVEEKQNVYCGLNWKCQCLWAR